MKETYTITEENVTEIVYQEVGGIFAKVLEYAGVFKRDASGQAAFMRFINKL